MSDCGVRTHSLTELNAQCALTQVALEPGRCDFDARILDFAHLSNYHDQNLFICKSFLCFFARNRNVRVMMTRRRSPTGHLFVFRTRIFPPRDRLFRALSRRKCFSLFFFLLFLNFGRKRRRRAKRLDREISYDSAIDSIHPHSLHPMMLQRVIFTAGFYCFFALVYFSCAHNFTLIKSLPRQDVNWFHCIERFQPLWWHSINCHFAGWQILHRASALQASSKRGEKMGNISLDDCINKVFIFASISLSDVRLLPLLVFQCLQQLAKIDGGDLKGARWSATIRSWMQPRGRFEVVREGIGNW